MVAASQFRRLVRLLVLWAGLCAPSSRLVAEGFDPCGGDCAPTALTCGDAVAGELAASDCAQDARSFDLWEWTPDSKGDAEVIVRAAGFTPRLVYAFPPGQFACRLVLEGTDACAPGDPSARCFRVPFVAGGRRLIQVTSVEEGGAGSYTLELRCAPRRCEPGCEKGSVECGGSASGRLEASDCVTTGGGRFHTWKKEFAARTRLRIAVDASAPVEIGLHYDAFFGGSGCHRLFAAPPCRTGACVDAVVDPGTYRVAVSGPADTTYRIDLSCEPFDSCTGCAPVGSIACGETKSARLELDDCAVHVATESGGSLQRRQRWSLDVAEAGSYRIRTEGTTSMAPWRILDRSDCSPATGASQEACGPAAGPTVQCGVVSLEAGAYWIEVSAGGDPATASPLEYSIEVACLDLGPCAARCFEPLDCGAPFAGSLCCADCTDAEGAFVDALLLEAPPPGPSDVQFTVSTDGFLPRLRLVDRLCNPIAADATCTAEGPTTACLSARLSPFDWTSKVYLLVSPDPSGPTTGSYDVVTDCVPFTPCIASCVRGAVRVGETRTGTLGAESCSEDGSVLSDAWTLDLSEPTFLDLSAQGEGFTPRVSLRGPDCSVVRGGISRAVSPVDPGAYTVVVESDPAAPGKGGPYTLQVRAVSCDACPPTSTLAVSADGKIEGTLEAGDCADAGGFLRDVWRIELPTLTLFRLYTNLADAPYVWILREDCTLFAAIVPTPSSALVGTLDAGAYTVVVTNLAPDRTGAYSFGFPCVEAAYCRAECSFGALQCGVPATGSLTPEDCDHSVYRMDTWTFDVPEGAGETTAYVGTPPGTSVYFTVVPGACDRQLDVQSLCQPVPGGAWSCALPPGPYRLAIYVDSSSALREPVAYEVTLSFAGGCSVAGGHLPGDCTTDGKLDLSDAVCLLGYLFLGETTAFACAAETPFDPGPGDILLLDWDGNARLAITDAIALLGHLFLGGPPHVLGEGCVQLPGCPAAGGPCGGQ